MNRFYIGADTEVLRQAKRFLESSRCSIADRPDSSVTHLLLPVPFSVEDASLRDLLPGLSPNVVIFGGNMPPLPGHQVFDLLRDPFYLAENAAITAECALRVAYLNLPATLAGQQVLILGWGRISKCLAQLLKAIGAQVTVAARKDADLAISAALGYEFLPISQLASRVSRFRLIFNTVPAPILGKSLENGCRADCLKIDLASVPGIAGDHVISARGLPGKLAPESSGQLIAKTVIRLCSNQEG